MPRMVGKKMLLVKDIWIAYAEKILKANPDWWSRYVAGKNCRHFRIGYYKDGKMVEAGSYTHFRNVIEHYFDRAKKAIIHGECINITSHLGKICVKRVERDFRSGKQRRIDWGKTNAAGKVWDEARGKMVFARIIYFTTDEWCRIGWLKNGTVENETIYEFIPTSRNSGGTTGFKLEFNEAQTADPLLKYQYLFFPLVLNPVWAKSS